MFVAVEAARSELERVAREVDPEQLSGPEAVRLLEDLGSVRRLCDGLLAKAAKRIAETREHQRIGDRDAASLCARVVGIDIGEARRAIETAAKLEQLPATAAAVRDGSLSARQAQMIADAATINPDAEPLLIASAARGLTPLKDACIAARALVEDGAARAARQHAARSLRIWTSDDGMVEGRFRLAPEVGGPLKAVIDTETQRIFRRRRSRVRLESHEAHAADALYTLVMGAPGLTSSSPRAERAKATVHVLIDHAALVRGEVGDGEQCEVPGVGPVSVAWARELLGTAFLTAVIKKGRDITTVAHFGRHVPAELQTALIAAGRTCVIEGCDARGYLERDHSEIDHARGGPTAWWNMTWCCSPHHRLKSMGWILGPPDPETGRRRLFPPGDERATAA